MILDDLLEPLTDEDHALDWNDDGLFVFPRMIDEDTVAAYERVWWTTNGCPHCPTELECTHATSTWRSPHGFASEVAYRHVPELLDLCTHPKLVAALEVIVGEPCGVHLNLTGWVSTQRNWHQDGYLNPPDVGDHYAAVWFALDRVSVMAGPFEYVPGSHKWGRLTRERTFAELRERGLDEHHPDWPRYTEEFLTAAADKAIADRGVQVERFMARRGDVLVWHPRLLHRGGNPIQPGMPRLACIAHYSGIHHRADMPTAEPHRGGYYFPL